MDLAWLEWSAAATGDEPPLVMLGVALGVTVVMLVILAVVIRRSIYICPPNELLVITGRPRILPDGRRVGYRLLRGGRTFRLPFLERVDRISLQNIPVSFRVENAYASNGVPLDLEVGANVRIAGDSPLADNAVERFLGRSREEVAQVAAETLTGSLREVVAKRTADEVRTDAPGLAAALRPLAEHQLAKLGLILEDVSFRRVESAAGGTADSWRPQHVPGAG
jgi:flotillin